MVQAKDESATANASIKVTGNTGVAFSLAEPPAQGCIPTSATVAGMEGNKSPGGAVNESAVSATSSVIGGGNDGPRALDRFALFPKLPVELRLRVWKFSLPGKLLHLQI